MSRQFNSRSATRETVPLLVGLVGASGSGKTYSALRIATGIQKIKTGPIAFIGTESRRCLHYADSFNFEFIEFKAPHSSLDYISALVYAESLKPSVIVIDSASHEKEGVGGMLDLHEQEVERMAGNDYAKRERVKMLAWSLPKQNHRKFINKILQMNANMIFCFRAKEISKPTKDKNTGKSVVQEMGFIPVASDDLVYEMTINCMLMPRSNGRPIWESDRLGERMAMKLPEQFRTMFEGKDIQLNEQIGEQLALWAKGGVKENHPATKPEAPPAEKPEILTKLEDYLAKGKVKSRSVELSGKQVDLLDKTNGAIEYIKGEISKGKPFTEQSKGYAGIVQILHYIEEPEPASEPEKDADDGLEIF